MDYQVMEIHNCLGQLGRNPAYFEVYMSYVGSSGYTNHSNGNLGGMRKSLYLPN